MGCCITKPDGSSNAAAEDIEAAQLRDLRSRVMSDKNPTVSFRAAAVAIRVTALRNPILSSPRRGSGFRKPHQDDIPHGTQSSYSSHSYSHSPTSATVKHTSNLSTGYTTSLGSATRGNSTTWLPQEDDAMLVRSIDSDDDLPC